MAVSYTIFKSLIYNGLTSGHVVCSYPILRLTNGRVVCLAITQFTFSYPIPKLTTNRAVRLTISSIPDY